VCATAWLMHKMSTLKENFDLLTIKNLEEEECGPYRLQKNELKVT